MPGLMNPELEEKIGSPASGAAAVESQSPEAESELEDDEGQPNVSEDEQKAYEDFVAEGLLLIYEGGEVRPAILEFLDEDPADLIAILGEVAELQEFNPSVALAATAVVIVLELVRSKPSQFEDDPEGEKADAVILHGGKELLEDLANLAAEAGIHDFSQEEMNRAWYLAMDLYREAASAEGLLDTEKLKAEFAAIKAADERGEFGGGEQLEPVAEPAPAMGGDDELRR